MHKTKRKPSEYPQFAFRVSEELKKELSELIEEVTNLYNTHVKDSEYLYRKNEIIIEALEIGLMQMKKNPAKRATRKE